MRRDSYRFLLWGLTVAALAFAGDRLIAKCCEELLRSSHQRFADLYNGRLPTNGIVAIGDSRGINSVYAPEVSRITGKPVTNLSYNGMSTKLAGAIVSDYLDHYPHPSLVIIEITSLDQTPALVNEMKTFSSHSARLTSLISEFSPKSAAALSISHAFRYDSEMFLRALYYIGRSDQDWINRYEISPAVIAEARSEDPWRLDLRNENLHALHMMIDMLRARGVPYRLLIGPYLPEHRARWANEDALRDAVHKAAGSDAYIWDYSDAIADTVGGRSAFSDRLHLNLNGGIVLMHILDRDCFFDSGASRPCSAQYQTATRVR